MTSYAPPPALHARIVAWRRHLHQYPELSFQEHQTSAHVEAQLRALPTLTMTRSTPTSMLAVLLLLQAQAATRPAQVRVYRRFQQLTDDAAVRLPPVHSRPLAAKVKTLSGWVPSPLGTESFAGVSKP